jgi:hypothetical protein
MAKREHPSEAAGQIQADNQDDKDAQVYEQPLPKRQARHLKRGQQRGQQNDRG